MHEAGPNPGDGRPAGPVVRRLRESWQDRRPELRPDPEVLRSWRSGVEWDRKGIHLISTVLALWTFWMDEPLATAGLAAAMLFVLAVDVGRLASRRWAVLLYRRLPLVFRRDERRALSGASVMMIGATATSALFGPGPATAGILCLTWGDSAAAVVGQLFTHWRRMRRLRRRAVQAAPAVITRRGKTWAGTLGCLVVSMAMITLAMGPDPRVVVAGGATAALMERWTPGRWDNLTIPLATAGVVLWAATWLP